MLMTLMFSLNPGTPGLRQHMPRMISCIRTPAWEAWYRATIMSGSTRELIFAITRAGCPARARSLSRCSRFTMSSRIDVGERMRW